MQVAYSPRCHRMLALWLPLGVHAIHHAIRHVYKQPRTGVLVYGLPLGLLPLSLALVMLCVSPSTVLPHRELNTRSEPVAE